MRPVFAVLLVAAFTVPLWVSPEAAADLPPRPPIGDGAKVDARIAKHDAWLKDCAPEHAWGRLDRVTDLGGDKHQGIFKNDKSKARALFIGSDATKCANAYVFDGPSASGNFLPGRKTVAQVAEQVGSCVSEDEGGCQAYAVVRATSAGAILASHDLGSCPDATIEAKKVFGSNHLSVLASCTYPGGGDLFSHRLYLLHFSAPGAQELVSVEKGYSEGAQEKAHCRAAATGYLKITKSGRASVIAVFEPTDDEWANGTEKRYRWADNKFYVARRRSGTVKKRPQICAKK